MFVFDIDKVSYLGVRMLFFTVSDHIFLNILIF